MFQRAETKQLISRLDEQPAPPHIRASVANAILALSNPNDSLIRDVLDQYEISFESAALAKKLQDKIHETRLTFDGVERNASLYHLAWSVFPSETELDGYLAEFYIHWAKEIGLQEDNVVKIFSSHGL